MTGELKRRAGGCHCGAVRFEVCCPDAVEVSTCNCSMCAKSGFIHLIVDGARFRITQGVDHLTSYRFNTGVAEHLFCRTCGIKSFYHPRSRPDGWSVNVKALDDPGAQTLTTKLFDGQNWETHFAGLSPEDRHSV